MAGSKAITKLVSFGENGGDIDFVAPPPAEDDETTEAEGKSGEDAEVLLQIQELSTLILSYQEEREAVRLLSDQSKPGS